IESFCAHPAKDAYRTPGHRKLDAACITTPRVIECYQRVHNALRSFADRLSAKAEQTWVWPALAAHARLRSRCSCVGRYLQSINADEVSVPACLPRKPLAPIARFSPFCTDQLLQLQGLVNPPKCPKRSIPQ